MKTKPQLFTILLISLVFLLIDSCRPKKKDDEKPPVIKKDFTFSGTIRSSKGDLINDATILINGKEMQSDKEGKFKISADSSKRFVVTIKKHGYGTISKIFTQPMKEYNYKMQVAFVKTIDPRKENIIHDELSKSGCTGSTSFKNLSFDAEYKKIPFVYDTKGNLIDFGWTPGMKPVFDQFAGPPICNPGATIAIPANTIVDDNGTPAKEPLTIAITTIDLQSEDGMPGDYTYQSERGTGAMVSMGAVSIELYSEKKTFNLDPKAKQKAKLTLPVDPTKMKFNKQIPETIPVLYYNEKTGYWKQESNQIARLNKKTKAYETEVYHFSSINLDFFQGAETCYKFRQDPGGDATLVKTPYRVYAMTPSAAFTIHGGDEVPQSDPNSCIFKDGSNFHFLYNGPAPGNELCVILSNDSSSPNAFYGISIVKNTQAYSNNPADLNYVDVISCPCTGAAGPCYNGTTCDEALGTCVPLCVPIPIKLYPPTQNVILAGIKVGNCVANKKSARIKWIFQAPLAAGTTFTYRLQAKPQSGLPADYADIPFSGVYTGNGTYDTGGSSLAPGVYPVFQLDLDIPCNTSALEATNVKILIHDSGALPPDYESDPILIDP